MHFGARTHKPPSRDDNLKMDCHIAVAQRITGSENRLAYSVRCVKQEMDPPSALQPVYLAFVYSNYRPTLQR